MDELNKIRDEIDGIDHQVVDLLNRRASLAQEIGRLKGRDGKPFFTPERERAIFEQLAAINPGPLMSSQLQSIYREIISAARALEQPLRATFWGPFGTFSHIAAAQSFGASSDLIPVDSIQEVFLKVEHSEADYGVVPVENSLAGVVPETLDAFPLTNVKICAELYVQIHHHLVSTETELGAIKRVYAGPQPGAQCRRWLQTNIPDAEIVEVVPTAKAAERARTESGSAAIANSVGAELVGIPILRSNIQDSANNRTRFLVVGFNEPKRTGRDKTSLMFNLRNRPGELYHALGALYQHDVNLLMIESRPAPRSSFEYLFFIDCIGHREDENMTNAIEALKAAALETVVLGSYPSAE